MKLLLPVLSCAALWLEAADPGLKKLAQSSLLSPVMGIPPEMQWSKLPTSPPDPRGNPRSPTKVELGRLLFFDPILSSSRSVACATCHDPRWAWADGRRTPIGIGGTGSGPSRVFSQATAAPPVLRNTPTLLNVGFNGLVTGVPLSAESAPMFWDLRVQGLEQQVAVPLSTHGEMLGDGDEPSRASAEAVTRLQSIPEYVQRFGAAFGGSGPVAVNQGRISQAIAAFERSLISPPSAFDRFADGDESALNAEQRRGMRAFQDAGCLHCHGGPMFSDFKKHFIGVPDADPNGRHEVRTPSLRNLRHTAPYMHNGTLGTLSEALKFYDDLAESVSETLDGGDQTVQPPLDPLLKHLNLNPDNLSDIEAFLNALSSADYDRSRPKSVPSGLTIEP